MKNPLGKRFVRELRSDAGKYAVIFFFVSVMICVVSGFLVASESMSTAYVESFEKYNIEHGNFELSEKADREIIRAAEKEDAELFENFYTEAELDDGSTVRIFKKREEVNLVCLMSGEFPVGENEIAIDRMYAENNGIGEGDTIAVGNKELTVCGLVALSDYSALYRSNTDMMFDAKRFGVAVMTEQGFDTFGKTGLHYSYSWKYESDPESDEEAKEMSEELLEKLAGAAYVKGIQIENFVPAYLNQAIIFTGDDISRDSLMITAFLYAVVIIIAFIFAITTANTVAKESAVIGTLRASGYSKGELVNHYLAMPMLVTLAAAVTGNILGYTVFKDIAADMYYASYSLPTFVTLWNTSAFIKTTVVPLVIMFLINFLVLWNKLRLSPLKFMRRDLGKSRNKNAVRLNEKRGFVERYRMRVILQNLPNYITIAVGVLFANFILLFGLFFNPLLDKFADDITSNMISDYQYVLRSEKETKNESAEKYRLKTLETLEGRLACEQVTVYGISQDSRYIKADLEKGTAISNAFAEKFDIGVGDTVTLKEEYGDEEYSFTVGEIYYYPAAVSVFMDMESFEELFDLESGHFDGYFSDKEIYDIRKSDIATVITAEDMTKTSRQMKHSIGTIMNVFAVFGVAMFMLIIYLLSKLIIEKNTQSISMAKVLGYSSKEINSIYIRSTTIVVVISIIATLPIVSVILGYVCELVFSAYAGWVPFYIPLYIYVLAAVLGIAAYAIVAFVQMKKVKKIPMTDALKNVE